MRLLNIIIGLDGFHKELLGYTSHICELYEKGSSGTMESVIPTVTSAAHGTIQTSLNPGMHGLSGFLKEDGSVIDSRDIKKRTFYEILDENNYSIFLMNLPLTHPPKIGGDLVTSWLTKSQEKQDFVYPKDLFRRYSALEDYMFHIETGEGNKFHKEKLESRFPLIKEVLEEREHDLAFFYIHATDAVQHASYNVISNPQKEAKKVFRLADKIVGSALSKMREKDNLIIMSDHGFSFKEGKFTINDWLKEKGYLKTKKGGQSMSKYKGISDKDRFDVGDIGLKLWNSPFRKLLEPMKNTIESKLNLTTVSDLGLDMDQSKAYGRNAFDRGIFINSKFNREEVKEELLSDLKSLSDIRAVPQEEAYSSEKIQSNLADVFLLSEKWKIEAGFHGSPYNKEPTTDHHLDGIFIGYGEKFAENEISSSLFDFAPTILDIHGQTIPEFMEGESLAQ